MSEGPKCVVCEQEISFSQMFDNYGTGLFVHRGCAKRAVNTHRELVDIAESFDELIRAYPPGAFETLRRIAPENAEAMALLKDHIGDVLAKAKVQPCI